MNRPGSKNFRCGILLLAGLFMAACEFNPAKSETPEATSKPANNHLAEIYTQLGIEYMNNGQNEVAMKKLQRALEIDSNYALAHNAMGLLDARLGENEKALASFKRALDISPNDPNILNNYGLFLCRAGKAAEGQEQFALALKNPLYQNPEIAYTNAGICAEQQKDPAGAEVFLRQALEHDPKMAVALLEMAKVSLQQEKYLPARGYLERYSSEAPHTAQSLWLGVQIERKLGNKDAAGSYAVTLKGKYPDSPEARQLQESGE
ncbi:MAG TPA: type IV pilus biogenesis/stability protein PilW [Gammaproteobacteria bacterium]|nr:type IV pilus biogenesis/stability protein PilW [Gammaproteobacteria bacterium]